MAKVGCEVTECIYNKQKACDAGKIEIQNDGHQDTDCKTFSTK
ncbi:DUF1540 domain-containing protein [Selenihalanaerobacter shriftii]|uniref:DUF1540 domain-containing protein n=1 Tax=Selenihalanaerobacter shriftii TaxID=142842 RepID=A0A1T4JQW1_9FIRM|nr:DUF1540 domain-containing protein [Selenihalanaerobacter shriftii]SJZ32566.1 protein of unknown function [Selenihalanaerobacter shriftii]